MIQRMELGRSGLQVPVAAVGCMRMANKTVSEARALIDAALEQGANFFDHADIYGGGKSEEIFAEAVGMNPAVREGLILQSKCAIHDGMYDFSKEHILKSVDGSLRRLKTEYLDVLLLHRPDILMEPEEVAEAFAELKAAGKVRHFGVSNQNPTQMQLLERAMDMPIVANQLQFSITNCTMISSGVNVNMENDPAINRDGAVLDFCRLNNITIQPWSPFQHGFFKGVYLGDNEKFPELNAKIDEVAEKYGITPTGVVIAWILRLPAHMQPIIGSMNPARMKDALAGAGVKLSREDWYGIYKAAGNRLP